MRRLVLGLAMAAVLATAAPARAADGDPYVQSCVVVVTSNGCATKAGFGRDPWAVAASPDGRQLYFTTSSTPSVLQIVDRDPATGVLTAGGCFGPASTSCTTLAPSVAGANGIAMSHDGRTLLIAADGSVLEFARDPGGGLTYAGAVGGADLPAAPDAVAFSPEDQFAYVRVTGGLSVLRRDASTSTLAPVACYTTVATQGCTTAVGLAADGYELGVSAAAVTVAFNQPGGVATFNRNPDGTLTPVSGPSGGCYSSDGSSGGVASQCKTGGALQFATLSTISPDGGTVYAGGPAGVTVYQRTGLGTLAATGSGAALADTTDLLLTPDGRDLVVAQFGGRLSYFTAVAGTLTQRAGAAGCMNGDGSGACQALGGLGGNANSRSFLATDASGLDVFATSDTKGMLASVVRDYRPVCHAASVTLPFETATAIHPDCADPNGDPLAYTVTSAPRSGSLSGTFVYTPAAGFSGTDQFTYFATGHGVSSAPATVALGVFRAPPIAPAAPPVVVHTPAPRRTVGALVGTRWEIHGTRFSLLQLTLSQLPKAWAAQIRCAGKHCPFARRTLKGRAKHGTASVLGSLKRSQRRFRAGQTLEVWVSAPGLNTKVARLVLKKGRIPSTQALCAAPGAKKAASRCG